jgi:uncharacterized protein (DUF924 family)
MESFDLVTQLQTLLLPKKEDSTSDVNSSAILDSSEEVLQFWFSGDLTLNYKTKWFPDGSVETQRRADETVLKQFGDLFSCAIDNGLNEWRKKIRSSVGLILVFDQFSRHIYRLQNLTSDDPRRAFVDAKALEIAEELTAVEGTISDKCMPVYVYICVYMY